MYRKPLFLILFIISTVLNSCEFHCSVGSNEEKEKKAQKAVEPYHQDGATIYNGIELTTHKVKLNKAFLIYENGDKVPDDNFIDFKDAVTLVLQIDSGWTVIGDRCWLGASEKVISETGKVIGEKNDMIADLAEGYPAEDAKIIRLSMGVNVTSGSPTYFTIPFRLWDKKGEGYIEGSYKLYSK